MDDKEQEQLVQLAHVIRAKLEVEHSEALPLFSLVIHRPSNLTAI